MLGDFPHTLLFHDYTVTKSGDEVLSLSASVKADVEEMSGLSQTNYSDEAIGTLNASIPANDPYYLAKNGKIEGKLVKYGDNWYRLTEAHPIESIVTNSLEFVDLILERAESPDGSNL